MLAAGAKAAAAELSGVRVGRIFVICHMLSGALAAVAAMMVVARNGAAIPSMAGQLGQDWLSAGVSRAGARRHAADRRTRLGARRVSRIGPGHDADQRPAAIARRRILGAGLARAAAADRGADRSGAAILPRSKERLADGRALSLASRGLVRPARSSSWSAAIAIAVLRPSFLSPFNIQILLLAIAVNMLIALSQMVIIAIGQMNLAVGAHRRPRRDLLRRHDAGLGSAAHAGGLGRSGDRDPLPVSSTALSSPAPASRPSSSRWRPLDLQGRQPRHHPRAAVLRRPGEREGVRQHDLHRSPSLAGPPDGRLLWPSSGILLNRQPFGRYILAVGGNASAAELSGISVSRTIVSAHAISGFLAALAGIMLVARLQLGQPTDRRRLADPVLRRAGDRRRGARRRPCQRGRHRPRRRRSSPSSPRRWCSSRSTRSSSRSCSAS